MDTVTEARYPKSAPRPDTESTILPMAGKRLPLSSRKMFAFTNNYGYKNEPISNATVMTRKTR